MSDLICFISPIKFFNDFLGVFCLLVAFAAGILITERLALPEKFLDHLDVTCLDLSSLVRLIF